MENCASPVGDGLARTLDDAEHRDVTLVRLLGTGLPRLQRVARLLCGDGPAADDLVAEAIARTLPRWRAGEVEDVQGYLRRTVVNLAARRWRRRALAGRRDHAALDWSRPSDDVATATVERDATLARIMRLPVRRRAVVVLRFYDDLPEARIAEVMGTSIGTVKSQLSRALEQLRVELGDQDR